MNAEAYLRKQGWQGSGHSLDGEGRGIKKPLLIAHKQDQLGLGKKKAAYTTDDQWWMRAFDDSLKNIGSGQEVHMFSYPGMSQADLRPEHPQPDSEDGYQPRRSLWLFCERRGYCRYPRRFGQLVNTHRRLGCALRHKHASHLRVRQRNGEENDSEEQAQARGW